MRQAPPLLLGLLLGYFSLPAYGLEVSPLLQPFQNLAQNTSQTYTLACLPLTSHDSPAYPGLSHYLQEKIMQGFTKIPAFTVIERDNIEGLLKEQGFSQSAFVDPAHQIEIGKLLGARLLIAGSYTTLQDTIEVSLRLIDAENGKVVFTTENKLPHTEVTRELAHQSEKQAQKQTEDFQNFLKAVDSLANTTNAIGNLLDSTQPNRPSQQPLQPQQPPAGPPAAFQKQRIFYQDFQAYADGAVLPAIGPAFRVERSLKHRQHVLSAKDLFANGFRYPLELPRDFALEIHSFNEWLNPALELTLWRRDGQGVLRLRQQDQQFSLSPSLTAPGPWQRQGWNVVVLEKFQSQLRVYVNGSQTLQAQIPDTLWQGFELSSPKMSDWAFSRFALYRLSGR